MKLSMSNRTDFKIVATPVFKITLQRLCGFLSSKYGADFAEKTLSVIKSRVKELAANPYSAPVSDRMAALGFIHYRQLLVDQHNLVFYRIDEEDQKIVLVVAMDSRQSIEQLLYETTIIA